MQVRVLGPLEVTVDGQALVITGGRQRALLAVLALEVGRVVAVSQLIDAVWGEEQRADPKNALQAQISQLRRRLDTAGAGEVIVSRASGYLLDLEPDAIDAVRFERLASDGAAALERGELHRAAQLLGDALALWRGPALAELDATDAVAHEVVRLEEARLGALEARIEADLGLGRHTRLVGELESLTVQYPLRERLRGQLMLALYRCGRQADALAVYAATRRVLADELGIDPSPELQRRHEAILRQQDDQPAHRPPARGPAAPRAPDDRHDPDPRRAPGNLRRGLSSFVGRERDLERVARLVDAGRLVTLTGPGGVGKTRLATEIGLQLQSAERWPDGVWLVELAAIADPALVAEQVAETLGLHDADAFVPGTRSDAPQDATARLRAALADRQLLLIIDNAEHLIAAVAAIVADLLDHAAGVTVLCTSREPLAIVGETLWSVTSLQTPTASDAVALAEVQTTSAVQLFVDRAQATHPDLTLTDADAPLLARICQRLDGIPLALELAAARVRSLGLTQLASLLDDRFRLLAGGERTALPRQQTLRATVEWSWALLDPDEQRLFRRLSVFTGAVDLPAVVAVCGDAGGSLAEPDIAAILARLVDKSLVLTIQRDSTVHYRMLETLRAYAAEQLDAADETSQLRARHAQHTLEVALTIAPRLRSSAQLEALRELDDRLDDLRTALQWLEDEQRLDDGARLAGGLGWYWYLRGYRREGLRWTDAFRHAQDPVAGGLATAWWAFRSLGLTPASTTRPDLHQVLAPLRTHGTPDDLVFATSVAAFLALADDDLTACTGYLAEAHDAAATCQDPTLPAIVRFVEAAAQLRHGRYEDAEPALQDALAGFRTSGDRWGQVQCLIALIGVAELTQQPDRAVAHADEALQMALELRMPDLELFLHTRWAELSRACGDHELADSAIASARRVADELRPALPVHPSRVAAAGDTLGARASAARQEVVAWLRRVQVPDELAYTLGRLGAVQLTAELDDHDPDAPRPDDPQQQRIAEALEILAAAHMRQRADPDRAAYLLGAADTLRGNPTATRSPAGHQAQRVAANALGDAPFTAAIQRGRSATTTELLELLVHPDPSTA